MAKATTSTKKDKAEGATKAPARAKTATPKDGAHKTVTPSPELAAVIGGDAIPRTEVVSRVWDYIRKHELQNPADKREILADDKLEKVFGGKKATMFELNKHLSNHLK